MKYRSRAPTSRPLPYPVAWVPAGILGLALLTVSLGLGGCSTKDTTVASETAAEADTETSGSSESAEESTTASSTATSATTTSSSSGFVPMNDMISTNTCDPATQDCPDGEKCTGYVVEQGYCCVDANKCVPVEGNGQLGDPCVRTEDNDDCDAGLFCMTVTSGSTGDGVCLAFCSVATQDCSEDGLPDATCIAFNDGVLPLCQDSCDPITQDCAGELGCYGVGAQGFVCSVPGFEDGQGNDGDECFTIQSCKPGLGCTATEVLEGCSASRCCTPYCDLDEPDPCDAPEACVPYYEDGTAPPGYEGVGLCTLPA